MAEEKNKKTGTGKKRRLSDAPYIPDTEVPEPSVPNRAHTQMSLGNFDAGREMRKNDSSLGNFDVK